MMLEGTDHTTHRLRRRGLSVRAVLMTMVAAQAMCSALAYSSTSSPMKWS